MSAVWVSVMSGSLKSAVAVTVRPSGPEPACVAMEPSAGGRLGVCATAYRPQQATGVVPPRAHLGERARRWRRLPELVVAPAGDGAVGLDPAGVAHSPPLVVPIPPALRPSRAHLGERARWRRRLALSVVSPTGDGAVGLEPTGVLAPRAHLRERTRRWRGLAVMVEAPAGNTPVGLEPAVVVSPRAYLGKGVRRWRRPLAVIVVALAGYAPVGLEPAVDLPPGAHLSERARRWGRRPAPVAAPPWHGAVG